MSDANRHDLRFARAVAQAVVRESFPTEVDLFDAVWEQFCQQVAPGRRSVIDGLPVHSGITNEFAAPFVVMTIAAVVESIGDGSQRFELEQVRTAVREAARSLGVGGPRLVELVDAVSPKLHRAMRLLAGNSNSSVGRTHVDAKSAQARGTQRAEIPGTVNVEWWIAGKPMTPKPESILFEEAVCDARTMQVELTVNEIQGILDTPAATHPLREFSQRSLVGLWLALNGTGGFFTYKAISERRVDPGWEAHDSALRKYVYDANAMLLRILRRKVIPSVRHGRFYVPADGWSWCWIREHADRVRSILLKKA